MVNGEAGKGDTPRPVDRKKWEAAWAKYERKNHMRKRRKTEKENDGIGHIRLKKGDKVFRSDRHEMTFPKKVYFGLLKE
jgi:hypothetical protein